MTIIVTKGIVLPLLITVVIVDITGLLDGLGVVTIVLAPDDGVLAPNV